MDVVCGSGVAYKSLIFVCTLIIKRKYGTFKNMRADIGDFDDMKM